MNIINKRFYLFVFLLLLSYLFFISILYYEVWHSFYTLTFIITLLYILLFTLAYRWSQTAKKNHQLTSHLEKEVAIKTQELHNALKGAQLGYWRWNIQTNAHDVDAIWLEMLGLAPQDNTHKETDWNERIHPDDKKHIMPIIEHAISAKKPYVVEFRMLHSNGEYIWIQGSGAVIASDENNQPIELSGTHQNITQRKIKEQLEIHNAQYLSSLFDNNPNMIIITNAKRLLKVNRAFFNLFNEYNSLDDFTKEHPCICDYFNEEVGQSYISAEDWVDQVLNQKQSIAKIIHGGVTYYFALHAKKIFDVNNNLEYMVTFNDITETILLQRKFEIQSVTDPLTELFNRRHFNNLFHDEINRAFRQKHTVTLLILDIDHFKRYNDIYGHDLGDLLLVKFAQELTHQCRRSSEFAFRLGGEEFGIIYSGLTHEASLLRAEQICQSIYDMNLEHEGNLPSKILTVSIGHYCVLPNLFVQPEDVYHRADTALYSAKEKGRNRVEDYLTPEEESQK